jgi:hypothetical protein
MKVGKKTTFVMAIWLSHVLQSLILNLLTRKKGEQLTC